MKKLIISIIALLFVVLSSEAQQLRLWQTMTFYVNPDSYDYYYDTTFVVDLPYNSTWNDGTCMIEALWDDSTAVEVITDSALLQVRPGYHTVVLHGSAYADTCKPFIYSDGADADWKPVKIYDGNDTWTNWSLALPLTDGDHFWTTWEQGGKPWRSAIFHFELYDSNGTEEGKGVWKWNFFVK